MTGFKGIGGLYNRMQISIEELLGQRSACSLSMIKTL